jgi:hypothetical protein
MKVAILFSDADGFSKRAAMIKATAAVASIPFVCFSPPDKPQAHSMVIEIPASWIPAVPDPDRRDWFRNHLGYILAIRKTGIQADHYWCCEGDVQASPATWLRLLAATSNRPEDGLWTRLAHRDDSDGNKWFTHAGTPAWADWYCLGALFRLSARAVDWLEETAEESREMFTEICVPSQIAKRGGTLGRINQPHFPALYDCGTMKFTTRKNGEVVVPLSNPNKFRHPIKVDD